MTLYHNSIRFLCPNIMIKCQLSFITAWKNNALGKKKPWSRTKSEQKVWNRRPTSQRFREMQDEEEENNIIHSNNNGM